MDAVEALQAMLLANPYPGRGLVWSRLGDGAWCAAYFLTGRSEASQRRQIRLAPEGDLVVVPSESAGHDVLRHYVAATETADHAATEAQRWLVYGNGEQVVTIRERLRRGQSPVEALQDQTYEPDPPIFTARITVVADLRPPHPAWLAMARHARGARDAGLVVTVAAPELAPGDALLMTTYLSDGIQIETAGPLQETETAAAHPEALVDGIWSSLDPRYRVAVAAFHPGALGAARIRDRL